MIAIYSIFLLCVYIKYHLHRCCTNLMTHNNSTEFRRQFYLIQLNVPFSLIGKCSHAGSDQQIKGQTDGAPDRLHCTGGEVPNATKKNHAAAHSRSLLSPHQWGIEANSCLQIWSVVNAAILKMYFIARYDKIGLRRMLIKDTHL